MTNFATKNILQIKILETLTKRADFVAASKAEKFVGNSIIVQAKYNPSENIRVGYTASKKVGNAVVRNRAKRRMRAAAMLHFL